ncbi:MAG: hypothetical protein FI695_02410 [SAR202 cluster bacterium]|nr:hypothetical protein [Chloroflexota bacterium]MQG50816.1 hypothetical protein [SAR202 cluster bacterium]|tara:strand:- start:944 stop:2065 length:1122 start_codon:yes stop_codon:yes gene_type:complete
MINTNLNVDEITQKIAEQSPNINADRKIPDQLIDEMAQKGFFRLLIPKTYKGEEIDYLDYLALVQEISKADGSMGWCFNQNNILSTNAAIMPKTLAEEIWSDQRAILCNGPTQYANAIPTEGGYRLTGRWNFSSGSQHATWVIAISTIENKDPTKKLNMMIPQKDVNFFDVWQVNGLKGTGSFSFEVNDFFVPEKYTFPEFNETEEKGGLYVIPKNLLFASGFASVALGVARGALDKAIEISKTKVPQEQKLLQEQSATQREIGQAEALWGASNAFVLQKAEHVWSHAQKHGKLETKDRIELRLASTHAIRQSAEVVNMAYTICGASSIFEGNPIQRKFQDAHAITQQIQGRLSHYETVGQFFLGLEPQGRMF